MANPYRGEVTVPLDRPRKLRITLNDMAEIEDRYGGKPFYDILAKPTLSQLRMLIYLGLKHEDASLTEVEVGEMVDPSGLREIGEKLRTVFGIQETAEGSSPNARAAAEGTTPAA